MKKILSIGAFLTLLFGVANAEVIGIVDFDKVVDNYSRVKAVSNEISDKYAEIQRYSFDKEREYKKLSTPLERKNFEEAVARELSKKQDAYLKLKEKKEAEIDAAIKNAIKQVAITSKVTTVVEKSVVFFGGIDLTDKVVKQLNNPVSK
ncbi:MAG: OmpH family outer membrane protein [Candidatus Gastranaerophilales bacterium]|nr:OmpH family outer membrane protein [Candidatus Gastranaerophilales bacterium]